MDTFSPTRGCRLLAVLAALFAFLGCLAAYAGLCACLLMGFVSCAELGGSGCSAAIFILPAIPIGLAIVLMIAAYASMKAYTAVIQRYARLGTP